MHVACCKFIVLIKKLKIMKTESMINELEGKLTEEEMNNVNGGAILLGTDDSEYIMLPEEVNIPL